MKHKYWSKWLYAIIQLTIDVGLDCVRLIILNCGTIWRIKKNEYSLFISFPKYCLMLTNEPVGYPIRKASYFFKYKHFYILHIVGEEITAINDKKDD